MYKCMHYKDIYIYIYIYICMLDFVINMGPAVLLFQTIHNFQVGTCYKRTLS